MLYIYIQLYLYIYRKIGVPPNFHIIHTPEESAPALPALPAPTPGRKRGFLAGHHASVKKTSFWELTVANSD